MVTEMTVSPIEIAKLELNRGDVLWVRVPPDWSNGQMGNAHEAIRTAMRQADVNAPVLIGTTDVEIMIVRKNVDEE